MNGISTPILIGAIVAASVIATLLILILRRIGTQDELDPELLSQKNSEIEKFRTEKSDAERKLASEEQKASRIPGLEKDLQECRNLLESTRSEKADVEIKFATCLESERKLQQSLVDTHGRLVKEEGKLKTATDGLTQLQSEKSKVEEALARRVENVTNLQETEKVLRKDLEKMESERNAIRARFEELMQVKATSDAELAKLAETLDQERRQTEEKLTLLGEAREEMSNRFKALAEEILSRHGDTISKQNKEQIEGVLTPLREKMNEFQQGLQLAHSESLKDRTILAEQIRTLTESSAVMSTETQNLTRALKGEAQVQGAWGELILSTILEKSGLREGEEYLTQESHVGEDGKRIRSDVIVNLPGGEKIIIDSKVSLKAFEEYVNASSEADRSHAIQRHLISMRTHIKTLGSKDYNLAAGSRLDYVLMFIPIEGALAAAIQADADLTSLAAECNVAIATPTTLMIALRTVANVWKVERRNRNAEAIASRAGLLYDKFCGFVDDLSDIHKHLGKANDAYDEAMKKLTLGKGNLIAQAEQLKTLGAKASKTLPDSLVAEQELLLHSVDAQIENYVD
jgi:DNA recombination protein RmuC